METLRITEGDVLIVSDAHFGAGATLPNGKPNPHEAFFSDRDFARTLKSWKRRLEEKRRQESPPGGPFRTAPTQQGKRWLILNGDMIDYHAIPYKGSFRCVATEDAALPETQACIDGHPVVFAALSDFVVTGLDDELVFVVGNHDLEMEWPSVREMLLARIDPSGTSRSRIRFVREIVIDDDILVVHGDETDALSRKPKVEHTFITGKVEPLPAVLAAVVLLFTYSALIGVAKAVWSRDFAFSLEEVVLASVGFFALLSLVSAFIVKVFFSFIGKEKVYLNHPTSTYMNSWLGQRLRARMPWIGRMQNHGAIWFLSLVHNWSFAFLAFPAVFVYFSYHRFIVEPLDPKREHKKARFTIWETMRLLKSTMQGDQYESELDGFMKKHPKIRFLVMGHTHTPEDRLVRMGEREFRYLNTGTMIRQVRLITPQPETEPMTWLKMFFWRIAVYWRKRPRSALAITALHLVLAPLVFWGFRSLGWDVSAWFILGLAAFSLFWRQSYAQYRGEEFTKITPVEIRMTAEGGREVNLMHYEPQDDRWRRYLES